MIRLLIVGPGRVTVFLMVVPLAEVALKILVVVVETATICNLAIRVPVASPPGSFGGLVACLRAVSIRTFRHIHVFFNVILLGEIAFHRNLVQGESDCDQGQKGQKAKGSGTNHVSKEKGEIRAC